MKIIKLFAPLVLVVACGKGGVEAKLDEAAKLRDRMCECSDAECAKAVHDDYIAWKKGNKKGDEPNDEQMKRWESIRSELMACKHKLEGAAK